MTEETQKAAMALVNEIRRQNGLDPCKWDDIDETDQNRYALQAQAAHMSYLGIGCGA